MCHRGREGRAWNLLPVAVRCSRDGRSSAAPTTRRQRGGSVLDGALPPGSAGVDESLRQPEGARSIVVFDSEVHLVRNVIFVAVARMDGNKVAHEEGVVFLVSVAERHGKRGRTGGGDRDRFRTGCEHYVPIHRRIHQVSPKTQFRLTVRVDGIPGRLHEYERRNGSASLRVSLTGSLPTIGGRRPYRLHGLTARECAKRWWRVAPGAEMVTLGVGVVSSGTGLGGAGPGDTGAGGAGLGGAGLGGAGPGDAGPGAAGTGVAGPADGVGSLSVTATVADFGSPTVYDRRHRSVTLPNRCRRRRWPPHRR